MKVYLAGPISGLRYGNAQSWRDYVKDGLARLGIVGYSPLRAQEFLEDYGTLTESEYPDHVITSADAIMVRDHWDVQTSDAVFVNLLDTVQVTIGTVMELAWAYAYRKPTVLLMDEKNIHDHAMVRKAGIFRARTLDEGVDLTRAILLA
jgi:nucleoside 2-deoxyribosyltransferase